MLIRVPKRSLVAAAVTVVAAVATADPAQAVPSAQARLAAVAHAAPARSVVAIAQFKSGVSERRARALVRRHGARITDRLPMINGLALKLPAREAARLARDRRIAGLQLNTRVRNQGVDGGRLGTTYPLSVGADKLWAQGLTGRGVGVAVIDSGVSGDSADFKTADGTSRISANVIVNPGATRPGDEVGHGTHVAGIIAGNAYNRDPSDPDYGAYVGIAPEADLVALKTADDEGTSTVLDVINALQFVVDHRDDLHIKVVNLSVSSDTPQSYRTDPLDAAVEFVWHSGIVVVSAAGNRGDAADAVSYAPGNDPYVISVGGADEAGTVETADDTLAAWSSRGRTQDGFAKPELVAPGAHIVAPLAPGGLFASLCPACVVAGGYFRMGGTSMASPVVAGAAALLLQARPDLDPDQVKGILASTVRAIGDPASAGELAVDRAVAAPTVAANRGLLPNLTVAAAMVLNGIDPTRATWTRATWTRATWTRATWTRATWTRATWTSAPEQTASWARASWTCATCGDGSGGAQASGSRASWTLSSWASHPDW